MCQRAMTVEQINDDQKRPHKPLSPGRTDPGAALCPMRGPSPGQTSLQMEHPSGGPAQRCRGPGLHSVVAPGASGQLQAATRGGLATPRGSCSTQGPPLGAEAPSGLPLQPATCLPSPTRLLSLPKACAPLRGSSTEGAGAWARGRESWAPLCSLGASVP